jgi:uncharacterized protein YceH (UPF0502 family)
MSTDAPPPAAPTDWPPLPPLERRVLGVLVEKQKTSKTADAYPLTLNAVVLGSNQKSNRDPVMELTDDDASEALEGLQQKGLVTCIQGGRAERWKHELYTTWKVSKVELAVLAELLLRGPQTEGELRQRAARMEPIDDLDALRAVLKALAARKLVVYLTPEGRRGTVLTHGFHTPPELARARSLAASLPVSDAEPAPAAPAAAPVRVAEPAPDRLAPLEAKLAAAHDEASALRRELAEVRQAIERLSAQVRALQEQLGVAPSA